jgi:hypothetical protein
MKEKKPSDIVPDQQTGKAIDAETTVDLPSEEDAKAFFNTVKDRLQNVNEWKSYAGNLSAVFQLVDAKGSEVQRHVQRGDYFKIDIPGPGTKSGDGYDWVQVEDIENHNSPNGDRFAFRVRPTDNPQSNEKNDVAHFYSDESTSSFVVQRKGRTITASIHDRNTKPNTEAEHTADKVRDAVVGAAGVASFSKIQWKNLTDGLLKT